MTDTVNIRGLALEVLLEQERRPGRGELLSGVLEQYAYLAKRDRAFLSKIVEGTLENLILEDYVIDLFSKVPVSRQKPVVRMLLRMSVYQLMFLDSVPPSAVCNEAVKLAEKKGFRGLKGFVNGVLRAIARNLDKLPLPLVGEDPLRALSVRYSMPEWIVQQWLDVYPAAAVEEMLRSFLQTRPLTAHVYPEKCTAEQCAARLRGEGVRASVHERVPYAVTLEGFDRLSDLQTFQDGWFWIQDISSMMVCEAAEITQRTECVLDMCASPGGKSMHAASLLTNGVVLARDVSLHKLERIEENIARIGMSNIRTQQFDGRVFDPSAEECADVVLVDAPCSGLGVLGRKAEIKYRMTVSEQRKLVKLQRELLEQAARYVKPGGRLIYSTCTINRQENEQQVEWIVEKFGFRPIDLTETVGRFWNGSAEGEQTFGGMETLKRGYVQLLPGIHGCDGFFLAAFKH